MPSLRRLQARQPGPRAQRPGRTLTKTTRAACAASSTATRTLSTARLPATARHSPGLGCSSQADAYTFSNTGNVYFGDGSNLTGVVGSDTSRVSKAGDIMSGTLTMAPSGLAFSDGTAQTTAGWTLVGNTNLDVAHFLGSSDGSPVHFRVGNALILRFESHYPWA